MSYLAVVKLLYFSPNWHFYVYFSIYPSDIIQISYLKSHLWGL